jgi:hypothetical protein
MILLAFSQIRVRRLLARSREWRDCATNLLEPMAKVQVALDGKWRVARWQTTAEKQKAENRKQNF